MIQKYDIVVVGAGNAGMVAALECAKAGKKTLLIEQHNLPGGCATSFVRGRFEFEPALHELVDVGNTNTWGEIGDLMRSYHVDVDWRQVPECFRAVGTFSDGSPLDATMPVGTDDFIDAMEEAVPGCRESVTKCFDLMAEVANGTRMLGKLKPQELMQQFPNFAAVAAAPTEDVWNALGVPQHAQDIMGAYWGYLGVSLDKLAFSHYSNMLYHLIKKRSYIPAHTSHEISCAMIERFREMGGEVWFNCRAEEFLFNGDRLCGVKTTAGVIPCDYVLANINPDIIYGKMMPKELVPEREKKLSAARDRKYSARCFTVYFGLNKSAEELGIKEYCIDVNNTSDSRTEYAKVFEPFEDKTKSVVFLCGNLASSEASPKGTAVGFFTTMHGPEEWSNVTPEEYMKLKNRYAKYYIEKTKELCGIDIGPYIEEVCVATPWTFARYIGTPEGAVYGYETRDWDAMSARMAMVDTDYPIKGLCPIGAAGPRGDGYSSAYVTGRMIAKLALKRLAEEGGAQ